MPRIPPITDVELAAGPLRVVGDVHLSEAEPEVANRFLAWIAAQEGTGGTVVLLGDLFDAWISRPMQHDPLPKRAIGAIQQLIRSGTAVTFMVGNRDVAFNGADDFDVQMWRDPTRARLGEKTVVFTHGDQLCTADHAYQAMRRVWYSPPAKLLRLLPYRTKRWLAAGARNLSRKETSKKPVFTMGIDYGAALRWLEAYDADALVAGHVHTGVHHRHAGPPEREILVLKDWEHGGSVITWDGEALALTTPV